MKIDLMKNGSNNLKSFMKLNLINIMITIFRFGVSTQNLAQKLGRNRGVIPFTFLYEISSFKLLFLIQQLTLVLPSKLQNCQWKLPHPSILSIPLLFFIKMTTFKQLNYGTSISIMLARRYFFLSI